MASTISINSSVWQRRKDQFIVKISAYSDIALQAGKEAIIAHMVAHAPSPSEEYRGIANSEYQATGKVYRKDPNKDYAEDNRIRFMKSGGGEQRYLKEALLDPDVQGMIFQPRTDLKQNVGFRIAPVLYLDSITKFEWVNATSKDEYGPFLSKHGTFFAFEYGLEYHIEPSSNRPSNKLGEKYVTPEPGVYATELTKKVQAHPMFTNINGAEILAIMKNALSGAVYGKD